MTFKTELKSRARASEVSILLLEIIYQWGIIWFEKNVVIKEIV